MSKAKKLLAALKTVHENIELIGSVVDIDRIVGISNAQGPLAKVLHGALLADEAINTTLNPQPSKTVKSRKLGKSTRKQLSASSRQ